MLRECFLLLGTVKGAQQRVPSIDSSHQDLPCTHSSPRTHVRVDYHEYHHSPVMADGNFMRSNQYPDYCDHWSPSRHNSVPWNSHDYQPFYPSSAWDRDFPVDPTKFDGLVHTREDYHCYHIQQHQRHEFHRRTEPFYDPTPWKQPLIQNGRFSIAAVWAKGENMIKTLVTGAKN
jgi:hypothetical protein